MYIDPNLDEGPIALKALGARYEKIHESIGQHGAIQYGELVIKKAFMLAYEYRFDSSSFFGLRKTNFYKGYAENINQREKEIEEVDDLDLPEFY